MRRVGEAETEAESERIEEVRADDGWTFWCSGCSALGEVHGCFGFGALVLSTLTGRRLEPHLNLHSDLVERGLAHMYFNSSREELSRPLPCSLEYGWVSRAWSLSLKL